MVTHEKLQILSEVLGVLLRLRPSDHLRGVDSPLLGAVCGDNAVRKRKVCKKFWVLVLAYAPEIVIVGVVALSVVLFWALYWAITP